MSPQHHFAPGDHRDRDLYARERVLNSAIIAADIGLGWEEYLEIFDGFYADEVEVTTDTETGPIRGRERIRALLFNFLAPLHVMVEIGGLAIDVRESPIHGDTTDETHSAWSVNLIGVSGRACVLKWCTPRTWLLRPLSAAVNDAMFSVLRLGERLHPELDAVFIAQPDRSVPLPTSTEIAKCWEDVHTELLSRFNALTSKEWLERHGNVSH